MISIRLARCETSRAAAPRSRTAIEGIVAVAALLVVVGVLIQLIRRPGRLRGVCYRVLGRQPDPDVDDATLADRIRSTIGPLEKKLDLPRIHVMVEDHVALLHGDVCWPHEAAALERAVRRVSGVRAVESHLHTGLLAGDVRPSEGRRRSRSRSTARPA
jgi:hypothetical protein